MSVSERHELSELQYRAIVISCIGRHSERNYYIRPADPFEFCA